MVKTLATEERCSQKTGALPRTSATNGKEVRFLHKVQLYGTLGIKSHETMNRAWLIRCDTVFRIGQGFLSFEDDGLDFSPQILVGSCRPKKDHPQKRAKSPSTL